ncbi:pilus assembly protein [Chromatium okenii]|uniref:Spy/CpxP family protein refolding chaperone n=1 Tax=Chromatium okenii TaxID=61644 RepID=UPI0019076D3D|nr:pilus assembly protein [Chromatium okenii]MBK1641206.1 pilus assembly protein [Chromatium okenii]
MNQHRIRTGLTSITAVTSLLLGASLVGADAVYARSDEGWRPDPTQRVGTYIDRMAKDLDLTEVQQTEIHKIMAAEQAQRDLQRVDTRKQITAVLTDIQRAKREEIMQTRMEHDLDRMTDRLDLTDDQVAQIKVLFDAQRTNPEMTRTQLREGIAAVLTDEQRTNLKDRKRSGGDR